MAFDFGGGVRTPGNFQIVEVLQVQPEFGIGIEVAGEAQSGVRSDAAALVNDFPNACGGDMEIQRQLVHREAERLHEILEEDFARVDRRHQVSRLTMSFLS